jgi:hypothetical protein
MEAVAQDCLPFVFSDVELKECKETYPAIYEVIAKQLIVDGIEDVKCKINSWSENERLRILKSIRQSSDWKFLANIENIKSKLKQVKGVEV